MKKYPVFEMYVKKSEEIVIVKQFEIIFAYCTAHSQRLNEYFLIVERFIDF